MRGLDDAKGQVRAGFEPKTAASPGVAFVSESFGDSCLGFATFGFPPPANAT
jgi:hypothetical protein